MVILHMKKPKSDLIVMRGYATLTTRTTPRQTLTNWATYPSFA